MTEIIAEIGQNHNGDMGLARELIWAAKNNGADVAKFQVYEARTLFPKEGNPWFEYNCQTELTRDQIFILADECKKAQIEFMASVFDVERIGWLLEVGVKRFKIASRSVHDPVLMAGLIKTKLPLIVSLGMWKEAEFPKVAADKVEFLYCVSKYPTALSDLHLASIDFKKYAGFSDHTLGVVAAQTALSRGAKIIEKHLTLNKGLYGPDHICSMDAQELLQLHTFRKDVERCL